MNAIRRVVFVMPWHISERGGGAEVQANYLAQELARRGFDVHYLCQTEKSSNIGLIHKLDWVYIHWTKPSGRFPWSDQKKYYSALNAIQPDLVVQRISSNVTYVIGRYCKEHQIPFIWICTDNVCPFKNMHLRRFEGRANLGNTNPVKYLVFFVSNLIMDIYRTRGMKFVTHAFTQNAFQKEQIRNNFGLFSYRMISGHPFPSIKMTVGERFNKKNIIWCGNLGKHKRPELFIMLAKEFEKSQYKFIMIGGHSDNDYVRKLVTNAPSNLIVVGQVPYSKINSYFNLATLLINTSVSEGFSNTYIQAWLRGIPLIVWNEFTDSIIKDQHLGYIVNNVNETKQVISTLLNDFNQYRESAITIEHYAKRNHSISVMTDSFIRNLGIESTTLPS